MLSTAIVYSLPMALGVALSPLPIAAVVTILVSTRPNNAPAFLLGWITGIFFIGAVVFIIPGLDTERGEPTLLSGWVRLVVGGVLLVVAVWQWRQKPSVNEPVKAPKALSKLDSINTVKTASMGFFLSTLNPKNLLLTFAGATYIDASMATPSQQTIALTIYAVFASLSIIIPIIAYTLFTDRVAAVLVDWKGWLIRNNAVLVAILLVFLGLLVIGNGLLIIASS